MPKKNYYVILTLNENTIYGYFLGSDMTKFYIANGFITTEDGKDFDFRDIRPMSAIEQSCFIEKETGVKSRGT